MEVWHFYYKVQFNSLFDITAQMVSVNFVIFLVIMAIFVLSLFIHFTVCILVIIYFIRKRINEANLSLDTTNLLVDSRRGRYGVENGFERVRDY